MAYGKNEGNQLSKAKYREVEHIEKNQTANKTEKNIMNRLYKYCLNILSKFIYIKIVAKDFYPVREGEETIELYKTELALSSDKELLQPVSQNEKNESHQKSNLSKHNSHLKKELEDLIYLKKSEYLKAKFSSGENKATINEYKQSLDKLTVKLNKINIEESGIDPHAPVYSNLNTYSGTKTNHSNPKKYKETVGRM